MSLESSLSVDRYLEMAESAGRVRRSIDADPLIDATGVLVTVRGEFIVLTGFVRRPSDVATIRRIAEDAMSYRVIDELVVAVGRVPRVDLPEAELILPSPAASEGHIARARR